MVAAEFARAKVNLFLHVTGRRKDGYHTLDSLAIFPPVGDLLQMDAAPELSLHVSGPFASGLSTEQNLIVQAARLFSRATGRVPACSFSLHKALPVSSGIGGGSADAAATLRLLARHFDEAIPADLPLNLGADVPVCVLSEPARMAGIGEILTEAPKLPDIGIVLVNPGLHVSTQAIFQARRGPFSLPARLSSAWFTAESMAKDLSRLSNDLEAPAVVLAPIIADVLTALRMNQNCLLARMSGSGATCFGLFRSANEATEAAKSLASPGWWVWGGSGTTPVTDPCCDHDTGQER